MMLDTCYCISDRIGLIDRIDISIKKCSKFFLNNGRFGYITLTQCGSGFLPH